ncbi:hypothetical protein V8E51_009614 [Hyaloscypha variabilis]
MIVRVHSNHLSQKRKPKLHPNALHQFAHSYESLSGTTADDLVRELKTNGIFSEDVSARKVQVLKQTLLNDNIMIDGLQYPHRLLIPFLTLGCLRLSRLDIFHPDPIILDVLADVANVLSALEPIPVRLSGERGE